MAASDPEDEPMLDGDAYNESEDEDFVPNAAATQGNESSADEEEEDEEDVGKKSAAAAASDPAKPGKGGRPRKQAKKKSKREDGEAEDIGFENSGDEAIVKKGVKRRRKEGRRAGGNAEGGEGGEGDDDDDDDDSGGEGGFVKTRAMRAVAAEEQARRPLATTAGATVDVDALWAEMNDPQAHKKVTTAPPPLPPTTTTTTTTLQAATAENEQLRTKTKPVTSEVENTRGHVQEDTIEIEVTFKFAGEVQTQKKKVPRSSEEAQKWLKRHPSAGQDGGDNNDGGGENVELASSVKAKRHPDTGEPLLRPLRRVSLWDPNPKGVVKGLPSNMLLLSDSLGAGGNKKLRVVDKSKLGWHTADDAVFNKKKPQKATKLNVVEKSKMDWQAHVDEVGDREELEKAAKAKGSYLGRRDFLEGVEAWKDEEERRRRVK